MAVTDLITLVPPGACAHLHTHPSLQGPGSLCAPVCTPPTLPVVTEVAEEPSSSGASPARLWLGVSVPQVLDQAGSEGSSCGQGPAVVTPGQARLVWLPGSVQHGD